MMGQKNFFRGILMATGVSVVIVLLCVFSLEIKAQTPSNTCPCSLAGQQRGACITKPAPVSYSLIGGVCYKNESFTSSFTATPSGTCTGYVGSPGSAGTVLTPAPMAKCTNPT